MPDTTLPQQELEDWMLTDLGICRKNLRDVEAARANIATELAKLQSQMSSLRQQNARLTDALEIVSAERDDYWSALDEIADGVADPEWTARESLGRNE